MLTVDSRAADELSLYERPEIWLNKLINRDGLYKDLASKLELDSTGKVSCSGTREIDYPPMRFHGGGELEVAKSFSLPPDLVDKFAGMQKNCLMGIFSLCERAWITIDNELFMWNYEDGEDLAYYDGVKDTIVCVGLANPRSGLLPSKVRHLLCVVTPLEIFVLGMTYVTSGERSCQDSANKILQVMPDPLYCLPTDNFTVSCMEATENGRIFFGTQEGSLLELTCSPIPGWSHDSVESLPNGRTGRCALINHSASTLSMLLPTVITSGFRTVDPICQLSCDTVRHLLYVRTENSSLSVYDYAGKSDSGPILNGVSGSLTRLASLSGSDMAHAAATAVRSIDRDQFQSLVSIIPLSSGLCYLMAVTKMGIRLYFGEHLRLMHIRLPPISPYGRIGLGEVKLTAETRGTVVFVSALPADITTSNAVTGSMSLDSRTPFIGQPTLTFGQPARLGEDSFSQTNGATHGQFDVPPHVLYTLSPDPYPWTANLTEVSSAAWCVGGAWALVVLPDDCDHLCAEIDSVNHTTMMSSPTSTDKTNDGSNPPCLSRGQPPVVLTQHLDPPYRRLLLISAQGLIHLRLANPLVRLKEFLMREASSNALNTSLNATGLIDQYSGNPTRLGTQSSLAYPSLVDLDDSVTDVALNTRFLSAYLHQFSPDEAICAALVIGAASSVDGRGIHAYVEQAVLYFAAEASQFWIPAVRRANPGLQQGQRQQALSTDRSLSSGLFLFSGLSVFFARLARTFWRSPLFRDASRVSAKASTSSELVSSGGFRSWMHTFVHVLASASPLRAGRTQQDAKQPIISRLDPDEISWLIHQVGFLQQFLRRQLNVRGGWLRASTTGLTPRSGAIVSRSHTTDDGDEYVDVVLLQRLAEELDKLLSAVLEVLGFWRIFSEHIVHKVVERLPGDQRALLLQFPFEVYVISLLDALFPSGLQSPPGLTVPGPPAQLLHHGPVLAGNLGATELITALINALIDYYLAEASQAVDSGVSLDTITSRLQCACPTLFANEDAMCAKASECLIQVNLLRAGMTSSDVNGTLDSSSVEQQPVSQSSAEIERLVLHALQLYTEAGPGLDLDGATERLIASGAWSGAVALCLSVAKQRDPTDVAVDCLKNGRRPSTEPLISDVKSDRWGRKPIFAQSELAATEGRYDAYHQLIKCIDRLWELTRLPADATDVLNQPTGHSGSLATTELAELSLTPPAARGLLQILLQDVIQSTDILAHFEILGWLLSRGLTDTAVSLNSPHLEAYLRSRLRQSPDDPDLRCLLWRHLEKRGARLEAAQVLEHLAVTPCRQLTLEARLDFAARAIVTVKAMPAAQQDLDYLHDLESRLELGQLQQQLYLELCNVLQSNTMTLLSSPSARSRSSRVGPPLVMENELHEAVFQLAHGPLLSLSEMFTDYADKFGLHESKLILLWAADSQDIALIKAIWRDLLRQLLSFGTSSPVRQMDTRGSRHSPPMRGSAATSGRRHGADTDRQRLIELALTECLSRLGHRFSVDGGLLSVKSQNFFPLPEIVCILEYYAIQHKLPQAWVPTVLRDTRLSCSSSILDAYDTLLHSKDSFWRLADVRSRLFVAFVTVIEDFLGTVSMQLPMRQRMLQVGHILDRVTGNLVDLSAESTKSVADLDADVGKGEVHRTRVIERLRRVHDQLQRYHR